MIRDDHHTVDLLVAGAGLAGLYAALQAAELGARVTLVSKGSLRSSNSFYAQGGVAAAIGPDDDPSQHMADTMLVGRGLCDPRAVELLVSDAPARMADLERMGVPFDRDRDGHLALGREGGHGRRRILHAGGSATGQHIAEVLIARVRSQPLISVLEHTAMLELIAEGGGCAGAWVIGHDELRPLRSRMTLIATGGAGALYARTTNPPGALGDGIAIARRAGATISDMEFVQFHPTALAVGDRAFLISEAVRGEGAHLVDERGRRFMLDVHPDGELAPRDVVAREIQNRLAGGEVSYLTLGHLDAAAVRDRFPNLVEGAARAGLDLTRDRLPVSPAAHYLMGGDRHRPGRRQRHRRPLRRGRVRVQRRARREPAGVELAARVLRLLPPRGRRRAGRRAGSRWRRDPPQHPLARAPLAELRRRMWSDAGPLREAAGLERMLEWLAYQPASNPRDVAQLIAAAALRRHESRGAHVRLDFPAEDPALAHRMPCPAQPQTV